MVVTDKRVNFFSGQEINVNDLEQEQVYLNTKIEQAIEDIGFSGVSEVNGLEVTLDAIIAEPITFIAEARTDEEVRNFRLFPETASDTTEQIIYQVFEAKTDNIERIDLQIQAINESGDSSFVFELRELENPTNPLSSLASNILFSDIIPITQLPTTSDSGLVRIDLSGTENNQGVSVTVGHHYALYMRFSKETGSQDQIRIFQSTAAQLTSLDSDLLAHFLIEGRFQQGLYNESAVFEQQVIYHKIEAAAVKIASGTAYFKGKAIKPITNEHRFLNLTDRRKTADALNYVAVRFLLESTDKEYQQRTQNLVATRLQDESEAEVFTQAEWDLEIAKPDDEKEYLLLAIVNDRNVLTFQSVTCIAVDDKTTNLAYANWLNPHVINPSGEALALRDVLSNKFVFFAENVPSSVVLTTENGVIIRDDQGEPTIDEVQDLYVELRLDDNNTQRLQMQVASDILGPPSYKNYYVTLDAEGEQIGATDQFTVESLTPNTFFNFVAVTESAREIFIQDYDIPIFRTDPATGETGQNLRAVDFEVNLKKGDLTALISENLRLGELSPTFGDDGSAISGYNTTLVTEEIPRRVGTVVSSTIVPRIDTVIELDPVTGVGSIAPLPIVNAAGEDLTNEDSSTFNTGIQDAIDDEDLTIKINGVDITLSGNSLSRGGAGNPMTLLGTVVFDSISGAVPYVGDRITVRDAVNKDNTRQDTVILPTLGTTTLTDDTLTFTVVTLGSGPGSDAGFADGETGTVFVGNRQILDGNGLPVTFDFASFSTADIDGTSLDTQQFLGEKTIVSQGELGGNATLDYNEIAINPLTGQIFFPLATIAVLNEIEVHDVVAAGNVNSTINTQYNGSGTSVVLDTIDGDNVVDIFPSSSNVIFVNTLGEIITRATYVSVATNTLTLDEELTGITIPIGSTCYITVNERPEITLEYLQREEVIENVEYFQLSNIPLGTSGALPLEDTTLAIQAAFATGDIAITINDDSTGSGSDLSIDSALVESGPLNNRIAGPFSLVSSDPNDPGRALVLATKEIALNTELGKLIFADGEFPAPTDVLKISYIKVTPIYVTSVAQTGGVYESRFDFNVNGKIDETDLSLFVEALGSSVGEPKYNAIFDFNSDGIVDSTDLELFRTSFGAVASGERDYSDATTARLNTVLIFKADNPLRQVAIARAVSAETSVDYPYGHTILFFENETPVLDPGAYIVRFGFAAALNLGVTSALLHTEDNLEDEILDLDSIIIRKAGSEERVTNVIDIQSTETASFDNVLSFDPPLLEDGDYIIETFWDSEQIAITDRRALLSTVEYEHNDRLIFGPFDLDFNDADFDRDGTGISIKLRDTDATFANGTNDTSGTHINGVELSDITFTVHLTVPNNDGITQTLWTWNGLGADPDTNKIRVEFNSNLQLECKNQGRNKAAVLHPFGVGINQVALMPKYAGGDLENSLSNLRLVRDDLGAPFATQTTQTTNGTNIGLGATGLQGTTGITTQGVTGVRGTQGMTGVLTEIPILNLDKSIFSLRTLLGRDASVNNSNALVIRSGLVLQAFDAPITSIASKATTLRVATDIIVDITSGNLPNGLDISSEAENGWYYIYLIGQSASPLTIAGVLSASSIQPDAAFLAAHGYDVFRRIGSVRNVGWNFLEACSVDGFTKYLDSQEIIMTAPGGTFVAKDCSTFVPPTSRRAEIAVHQSWTYQSSYYLYAGNPDFLLGLTGGGIIIHASGHGMSFGDQRGSVTNSIVDLNSSQEIALRRAGTTPSGLKVNAIGYFESI